jgi:sigma-B regulation protein RsbU (phosphoserine phosphatase)
MRFVNAGHNSPIIIRRSSDEKPEPVTLLLDGGGPVVGLLADAEYEEQQVQLQRGDLFIGYTDGISEAMTRRQEEWGEERMITAATLVWSRTAPEILRHIFAAADAFTAGAPQHDDMTLLLMKLED